VHVILDGRLMSDRSVIHDYLKQQLALPDYYGRNLDALYDLLTDRKDPLTVTIQHTAELANALGGYGVSLLVTFREAAEENPKLELIEEA